MNPSWLIGVKAPHGVHGGDPGAQVGTAPFTPPPAGEGPRPLDEPPAPNGEGEDAPT